MSAETSLLNPDAPGPIVTGSVFANVLQEMIALTQELAARRAFDADVADWLNANAFVKAFEAWRAGRGKPDPAPAPDAL